MTFISPFTECLFWPIMYDIQLKYYFLGTILEYVIPITSVSRVTENRRQVRKTIIFEFACMDDLFPESQHSHRINALLSSAEIGGDKMLINEDCVAATSYQAISLQLDTEKCFY